MARFNIIFGKFPGFCRLERFGLKRLMRFLGIYSGIIFISFLLVVFLVEDFAVKKIDENFRKKSKHLECNILQPCESYFIKHIFHRDIFHRPQVA